MDDPRRSTGPPVERDDRHAPVLGIGSGPDGVRGPVTSRVRLAPARRPGSVVR